MTTEKTGGEIKKIKVKGKTSEEATEEVIYSLNVIRHVGDMILDGSTTYEGSILQNNIYEFGSQSDVATANSYAQNTVVLKIEGNLTINEGVTLTSVKSARTDMVDQKECLYIAHGTLTNNGTISMTARGAKAEGQNVYLFKNIDDSFEYVPSVGATGAIGVAAIAPDSSAYGTTNKNGVSGTNGVGRQTGGGGSGSSSGYGMGGGKPNGNGTGGTGGRGTSYSGGTGGGGARAERVVATAGTGNNSGGTGGSSYGPGAGQGAGNPPGGTGGLLVVASGYIAGTGNFLSTGSSGITSSNADGGGSGGGSINIFVLKGERVGVNAIVSGVRSGRGGIGGTGTITNGSIVSGTFIPL